MYRLTEEGEKYAENGLPEIRLLKSEEKSMETLKSHMEDFGIALQWAKKNNWVSIEKGRIKIKKDVKKYQLQEALEKIAKGKPADEKDLKILEKRGLVERVRKDIYKQAKKIAGKKITNIDSSLLKTGLWREAKFKKYNVEAKGRKTYPGKKHPYQCFINEMKQKLLEMGFKEIAGKTIVTEFWNFDALFQAQNHPSRTWTETYLLKHPKYGTLPDKKLVERVKATHENGWKTGSKGWGYKWDEKKASRLMPIAHDTAISPMMLSSKELEIPGKYFQVVRCFRPDVIDATHGAEFNHMGGFVVDETLTFRNLLGLLKSFAIEIGGAEKVKFYPDYYPFTEPSIQLSAKHPELGWIELAGAGMFREEMTKPLGVDAPVIAWGIGVDRLAMLALGINDIRELFTQNLHWLREEKVV